MRTPVRGNFPRIHFFAAMLVLALLIAPSIIAQQITTGTIRGTVVDANGDVVPQANVEVKNVETGITKSLPTDDGGRFAFLQLQPGKYSGTATKQGFANAVLEET